MTPPPPRLTLTVGAVDLVRGSVETPDGHEIALTTKELDLLAYLAARPGEVVSRDVLLEHVWEVGPATLTRAVDHTVRRLRGKIEVDPANPEHLLTVHGAGYRLLVAAPSSATSRLLGRSHDLAALAHALSVDRVVTLLGTGGVGKSTLARSAVQAHPDAAWSELEPVRDAAGLTGAVATALGVDADGVVHTLQRRSPLLVLDGIEHLLPEAVGTVEAWLSQAPGLRLLLTSRVRTRLDGERVIPVAGLDEAAAVTLFAQAAARLGVEISDAERPVVARLVQALDRLPLAIELAAARAGVLGPGDLLARLDQRLNVLTGSGRTLRGTLAWSWDLLDTTARRGLARCAAFRGCFAVDAGEFVVGGDALGVLQGLRDASLVHGRTLPGGRRGLVLLESVRVFAEEVAGPDVDVGRARHLTWYADHALEWARGGARDRTDQERLAQAREEILAAHARAAATSDPRVVELATALEPLLASTGPRAAWREVARATQRAAPGPDSDALAARCSLLTGDPRAGLDLMEQVVAIAPTARRWADLAGARRAVGDVAGGEAALSAGRALADTPGDHAHLAMGEALICFDRGELAEAADALGIAAEAARAVGDARQAARAVLYLGHVTLERGRPAEAVRHYREVTEAAADLGADRMLGMALAHGALAAQEAGERHRALQLAERAEAVNEAVGNERFLAYSWLIRASLAVDAADASEALRHASRAHTRFEQLGDVRFAAVAAARVGVAHAVLGEIQAAERVFERARRSVGDPVVAAGVEILAGFVDLARGDAVRARARLAPTETDGNLVRTARRQLEAALSSKGT